MDYTQPFCVFGSKGMFPYARNGYLPALELPPEASKSLQTSSYTYPEFQRLQMLVLDLQNRMNKHIDYTNRQDRL
jgi:hypothetical protein